MSRYLSSIFPDDLETFYRLFVYVKRVNGGIENFSEHLQREIVKYGRKLFDRYLETFQNTQRKKQTLWEYIKTLAHSMYCLYEVCFGSTFLLFKTIQKRLDAFPAFFQALYSAIASISDLSFAADYSVPAGIAEYLDHAIRVEK